MKKLLLIYGDEGLKDAVAGHFSSSMDLRTIKGSVQGFAAFEAQRPGVVLLELPLPDCDGTGLLERIRSVDDGACVIVVTSKQDFETTVGVIKKGAFDVVPKPVDTVDLDTVVEKAFQSLEMHRRLRDLLEDAAHEYRVDTIIGKSRPMEEVFKTIGIASQSKVTTLIQGESGTGKELIARAIHYNSQERARPFVAINCSALVETLLESELFGHEKGAFTGALARKEGKFEVASNGTVFLDEIGEMSPALQVKLLRVLQEKSFERVGGSDPIRTDVRVIAATNRELKDLIKKGRFREDLYYRLKVITIDVPPLRERKEDIPLLVGHFLDKAERELHKKVRKVPEAIIDLFMSYSWPGNVRELENVITRGVLLAKGDVLLDVYLPGVRETDEQSGVSGWAPATMDEVEKTHIARTLVHTGWNKSRAVVLLGITMPRLLRKIRKYGIERGG